MNAPEWEVSDILDYGEDQNSILLTYACTVHPRDERARSMVSSHRSLCSEVMGENSLNEVYVFGKSSL